MIHKNLTVDFMDVRAELIYNFLSGLLGWASTSRSEVVSCLNNAKGNARSQSRRKPASNNEEAKHP